MIEWRRVIQSYVCDECGAGPGYPCITKSGKVKTECHAIRGQDADRCKCGARLSSETDIGGLCARCEQVRSLEIERATKYQRRR